MAFMLAPTRGPVVVLAGEGFTVGLAAVLGRPLLSVPVLEAAVAVLEAGLFLVGPPTFFLAAAVPGREGAAGAASSGSSVAAPAASGLAAIALAFAFSSSGLTVYCKAGFKSRIPSRNAAAPQ